MTKLASRAGLGLSSLLSILIHGSVNRKIVVEAIKSIGEEGEKLLIFLLSNRNARIRACAAAVLGTVVSSEPSLKVIVNTDFASGFTSAPRVMFFNTHGAEYLQFDARELLAMLRRTLTEGVYGTDDPTTNVAPPRYDVVNNGITALLLDVLDKKPTSDVSLVAPGLHGHDSSLDPLHAYYRSLYQPQEQDIYEPEQVNLLPETTLALGNALFDPDEVVRINTAESLGKIGLPEASAAIEPLRAALKDQSNKVRAAAVEALGLMGQQIDDHSIVDVIMPLLKDKHWNVRVAACIALSQYHHLLDRERLRQLLPALTKVLKDGTITRNEVAKTMMSLGEKGIIQLMTILQQENQTTSQVRISAAYGLSLCELSNESLAYDSTSSALIIDQVVECLFHSANDRVPIVRRAVICALGQLAQRAQESVTYLRTRSLLPFLCMCYYLSLICIDGFLKDKEISVRYMAAEVMSNAGPHGELLLIEGLLKDANHVIRASAAHGLGHVGPKTIRTLLLALNDKDPMVLKAVAEAIESIGVPAIVE
jgi:HEAT repeat protein